MRQDTERLSWSEWRRRRRRSERMKESIERDRVRRGESDGGCGAYLYLGDIVLVLGRCGSLKRSRIPTWRHFRHSETGRDAHACASMHSVAHVCSAWAHMFTQTVIGDCWLPQRWFHACWRERVQAGMVSMANKECFVPIPPHPLYVTFSSLVQASTSAIQLQHCTWRRVLYSVQILSSQACLCSQDLIWYALHSSTKLAEHSAVNNVFLAVTSR